MKRIEFIAPVEAMRGNLSGAQKLQYPTDDQGAYEGPVGSKNYARNYSPRFVGSKRASDGRKYFSVRTKTANHLTAKSKTAMALMGGTGAIVGYILGHKSEAVYTSLMACWIKSQEMGNKQTFRQFASYYVRAMLISKQPSTVLHIGTSTATIDNPWNNTSSTPNVTVSREVLVKFWTELAKDGIYYFVDGQQGIAFEDQELSTLIGTPINILDLSVQIIDGTSYIVRTADRFLMDGENYVTDASTVSPNAEYITTDVAPTA